MFSKYVVLDRYVEHGDYVVRYAVRNKLDCTVNGGCYVPTSADVYRHDYYGGTQTAARFDYNLRRIPGAFHPGLSFASSHVLHTPVDTGINVNGVGETPMQDISQETQILKESAKTTQTSGVHRTLDTLPECTYVKHTEYEGEQRNISTGGHCTEQSKMAKVDIGRIHANVGVTAQVQQQGKVSRGAQYEAYASGEALNVTVGKNTTRQSGSGEFLQSKSVRGTAESPMGQVAQTSTSTENIPATQTSAGLANANMTGHMSVSESYGGQGVAGVTFDSKLTIYPGTSPVMGSATREVVQESIQGISDRELSAQQNTQTTTEVSLWNASGGRVTSTDGSTGQFGGRVSTFDQANAQTRDVTVVSGGLESVTTREERLQTSTSTQQSAVVQTETQGATEATLESTCQSVEASAGAGLGIGNTAGCVAFAESVGQYGGDHGGRVQGATVDVTTVGGREVARETGMEEEPTRKAKKSTQLATETSAREIVQISTQEIIQTSGQEASQSSIAAQQIGQASLNEVTVTHPNAKSAADSIGNYREHVERVREETVEVIILTGTEDVEALETSTRDVIQSSAQIMTTEASGEVDPERSGNRITFSEDEEQGGGRLSMWGNTEMEMQQSATESSMQLTTESSSTLQSTTESSTTQTTTESSTLQSATESSTQSLHASAGLDVEATGVVNDTTLRAGQSRSRHSSTNETVVGSTQEISQSPTQVTTQAAGGDLITETVTRVGGRIVPGYIRGPGESGAGIQVSVVEQAREVRGLEGDVGAIGKLVKEVLQDRVSSLGEVVQTTTEQVMTTGVGTSTQIAVVDSERYGRELGDVVSSSVEDVASATMRTAEVVGGTIVDAIAIANERFDAKFSSSEPTLVNKQSSGIATAVSAEDSRVNATPITAGERIDTLLTRELEGGVQTVITSGLSSEVNMVEAGDTENMERECTYPLRHGL